MKYYIKRYIILFFTIEIISRLIPLILKTISPDIFTEQISKGVTQTFGIGYYISITSSLIAAAIYGVIDSMLINKK